MTVVLTVVYKKKMTIIVMRIISEKNENYRISQWEKWWRMRAQIIMVLKIGFIFFYTKAFFFFCFLMILG